MLEVTDMLGSKRSVEKTNSAFIVYVNPQTLEEKTLEIESSKFEFVIGRGQNCDLVVSNPAVSRTHCIIKHDYDEASWILLDKSLSGTYVNKERIIHGTRYALCTNDTITLSGPYHYPFYFYIGDSFMKKKQKLLNCGNVNATRNIDGKENKKLLKVSLKDDNNKSDSVIILSGEEDENNGGSPRLSSNNGGNEIDQGDIVGKEIDKNTSDSGSVSSISNNDSKKFKSYKKKLEVNNEDNIITKDNSDGNIIQSLQLNLKKLKDDKSMLMQRVLSSDELIESLKLELQVMECRNKLNNETIDNLKLELNDLKTNLVEKDNDLKIVEARLFVAEQNETKEEVVKAEVMLKVNEDIIELLENELQCSICNEVIIEATVLNCTHLFCYICISTWMKKKNECAVCRTQIKDCVKSRALDSFIDKILQKYCPAELLQHRKEIVEERKKKEKTPARAQRNRGRSNGGRIAARVAAAAAAAREVMQQQQATVTVIDHGIYAGAGHVNRPPIIRPFRPHQGHEANIARIFNRLGAYLPEIEHLPNHFAEDLNEINNELINDNELMNELFPIVNLTNDAIDLRINRRLRRGRRRQPAPLQAGDIIDLRYSPDRD